MPSSLPPSKPIRPRTATRTTRMTSTAAMDLVLSSIEGLKQAIDGLNESSERLSESNKDLQRSFETLRDSLPQNFMPRAENQRAIDALQASDERHEQRITQLETARIQEMEQRLNGQNRLTNTFAEARMTDTKETHEMQSRLYTILLTSGASAILFLLGILASHLLR